MKIKRHANGKSLFWNYIMKSLINEFLHFNYHFWKIICQHSPLLRNSHPPPLSTTKKKVQLSEHLPLLLFGVTRPSRTLEYQWILAVLFRPFFVGDDQRHCGRRQQRMENESKILVNIWSPLSKLWGIHDPTSNESDELKAVDT